ncbi:MAG: sensor histidine kinase [Planctomycetota bacterium]
MNAHPADPWNHVVTLAAGLAHEIKNPLSTIALNLQLLQEDWEDAQTPRERRTLKRLQTLDRETSRLTRLLEDFLRYARTQAIEPTDCDLNAVIDEVLDFFAPQARRQGIEVRTTLDPDLPRLQADPERIKQALLNLALNARDAMPDGGELLVATARRGDRVEIDVTDTGVGVPDHHLAKLFNVYFSTKKEGSGLGLPATRRIVELHGGSIDVESEVHKGTHFTIRLPLAPQEESP